MTRVAAISSSLVTGFCTVVDEVDTATEGSSVGRSVGAPDTCCGAFPCGSGCPASWATSR
jgi:hypothetical protein